MAIFKSICFYSFVLLSPGINAIYKLDAFPEMTGTKLVITYGSGLDSRTFTSCY